MNISDLTQTHDSQRWYHRNGDGICLEVIGKTTGSPRKPTLRDARELGLLPGVTGICKIYPGAINWWSQDIKVAGELGSKRHEIVEAFHRNGYVEAMSDEDYRFIEPYVNWFNDSVPEVLSAESIITNLNHGYAGTMDLQCVLMDKRVAVVDLKNRKNPAFYDTDAMQLAAYRRAVGADVGISVILGTEKPEILVHEWTRAEDDLAWTCFEYCLKLWKLANKYDPELWKEPNEVLPTLPPVRNPNPAQVPERSGGVPGLRTGTRTTSEGKR